MAENIFDKWKKNPFKDYASKDRVPRLMLFDEESGSMKPVSSAEIRGEKGEKGDPGQSIRGEKGDPGINGRDGKNGINGRDGKDGKDGRNGKDGVDGKNGKDGVDGTGIESAAINDTDLIIKLTNGIEYNLGRVVGRDGRDGAKGGGAMFGVQVLNDGDAVGKGILAVNFTGAGVNSITKEGRQVNVDISGGGAVDSVNGQTGIVALDIDDIGGVVADGVTITGDGTTGSPLVAVGGGGMAIGDSVTGGTSGSVLFVDSSGDLAQDNANFFWDDANNRLGLGTASPNKIIQVNASGSNESTMSFTNASTGTGAGNGLLVGIGAGPTTDAYIYNYESSSTYIGTSNSAQFRIYSDGNIGMGKPATFTPIYNLDIRAPSGAATFHLGINDGGLYLSSNSFSASGAYMSGGAVQSSSGTQWIAKATTATLFGAYDGNVRIFNNSGLTAGSSYTPTERFTILTNGQTGINVSSPSAFFQVIGISTAVPISIFRGAPSQTGNLTEWQNSSGTALTYVEADGEIVIDQDSKAIKFGADQDATILYDGTNLVINPKAVGSGIVSVTGDVDATGNVDATTYSVGGVAGATGTFTTADAKTVTVTNGIITSIV